MYHFPHVSVLVSFCLLTAISGNVRAATPLVANTLYMCEFRNNGSLFKLNANNGQATLIGALKVSPACTDLAFRGSTLYGATFTKLMTIDPTTGKATLKSGTFGGGAGNINALVVQPGTNKLFGANGVAPGKFFEINPTTGKATLRGQFGSNLSSSGDMAFRNGVLFATVLNATDRRATYLAKISLNTATFGRATLIGPIRRVVNQRTTYLQDVFGLEVRSGVLYGAMRSGEFLRINPNNAIATLLGDNNKTQAGLAKSP